MAAHSPVLEDGSLVSRLDLSLLRLERFMAFLSGLAVFGPMVITVISVGGRNLFDAPLPGYVDWIEQMMPLIAFMGIAYVQRDGGHIRMDILIGQLRGRALWLAETLSVILILLLMLALVYPAVMVLNGGEAVASADSTFGMSGIMCAIWFGIPVNRVVPAAPRGMTVCQVVSGRNHLRGKPARA